MEYLNRVGFKTKKFLPYFACFSSGLFSFYNLFQISAFNAISADLLVTFHLTDVELGFFSSAYLLANALWIIPGGVLLDKYSARAIGLIFCAFDVLATFIIAISSTLLLSVMMRFVQGLASAISLLICIRFANEWFPDKTALVTGAIVSFALLGGVCANSFFAKLTIYWGWRSAMLFNGYIGLAFIVFMLFFLYDKYIRLPQKQNHESLTKKRKSKFFIEFKKLLHPDVILIARTTIIHGVYIGLMNLPIFILATLWGVLYLKQVYDITATVAPMICALIYLGLIIGAPTIGYLSDKFKNRKKPLIWASILVFLCVLPLLINKSLNVISIGIIFFFLGFFSSIPIINYTVLAESGTNKNISVRSGVALFIANLIGFFSQPLFGFLLNTNSRSIYNHHHILQYHGNNYMDALLMFPIAFIFCMLLSLLVKETYSKKNAIIEG